MNRIPALLSTLIFVALSAAVADADAQQIVQTIKGRSVTIAPPRGMCALNSAYEADEQHLDIMSEMLEPENKLIAMFAECSELDRSREQPALGFDNYETILFPSGVLDDGERYNRKEYLDEVRANLDLVEHFVSGDLAELLREKIAETGGELEIGQMTSLGLLASSADSLITGLIVAIIDDTGEPVRIAGVTAFTVLNGIPLMVNLYRSPYRDESTIAGLVGRLDRHTKALVEANGDVATSVGGWSIDWMRVLEKAIIGGVIGLAVWAVMFIFGAIRRKRVG